MGATARKKQGRSSGNTLADRPGGLSDRNDSGKKKKKNCLRRGGCHPVATAPVWLGSNTACTHRRFTPRRSVPAPVWTCPNGRGATIPVGHARRGDYRLAGFRLPYFRLMPPRRHFPARLWRIPLPAARRMGMARRPLPPRRPLLPRPPRFLPLPQKTQKSGQAQRAGTV